jgi:hypothetical protein
MYGSDVWDDNGSMRECRATNGNSIKLEKEIEATDDVCTTQISLNEDEYGAIGLERRGIQQC